MNAAAKTICARCGKEESDHFYSNRQCHTHYDGVFAESAPEGEVWPCVNPEPCADHPRMKLNMINNKLTWTLDWAKKWSDNLEKELNGNDALVLSDEALAILVLGQALKLAEEDAFKYRGLAK